MSNNSDSQPDRKDCCAPRAPIVLTTDCCCGDSSVSLGMKDHRLATYRSVATPAGDVPVVSATLTWRDRLGHWKVRWNIGRMRYAIAPGLYAIGNPTKESPVFVSANFKMSFDRLRAALAGRDGWILVLDTKGVNVWCAAGKGTFGTGEIVNSIAATRLSQIVSHRRLIVPQLGAPGVKAHEVKKLSGFTVHYGPVRAGDLPVYLDSGMNATPAMRLVRFGLCDRLLLVPVELIGWGKWALPLAVALACLAGFGSGWYTTDRVFSHGLLAAAAILAGLLAGTALTPILLPWLPGRAFAAKSGWAGAISLLLSGAILSVGWNMTVSWTEAVSSVLFVLTVASFTGMNFTGASTYTSLSGVRKEMRVAVPLQAAGGVLGLGFWIVARFL